MHNGGQANPTNVRALEELENAFRDAYRREENNGRIDLKTKAANEDWTTTLALVEKAAEALHIAQQRIEELEGRGDEIVQATRAQLQKAKASINAAESRALKAEQRANDAEEQAKQPREWLTRIHEGLEQLPLPA